MEEYILCISLHHEVPLLSELSDIVECVDVVLFGRSLQFCVYCYESACSSNASTGSITDRSCNSSR